MAKPAPQKVLLILGTRPEAVKLAPVYAALRRFSACFEPRLLVTGQHRGLLDQMLAFFSLQPHHDLDVIVRGQSLAGLAAGILPGLDRSLREERPDLILVQGDTSTAFLASLAAFYQRIPVAHVEAGLRTGDPDAPYPEEMHRRLIGALARWHFAPTARARDNLLAEGIRPEHIFVTGNTAIDALLQTAARRDLEAPPVLAQIPAAHRIILVTTHRRESQGGPLRRVYQACRRLLASQADAELVFPMHPNPAVRRVILEVLAGRERIHLIEPLAYGPFVRLMQQAHLVLTDSGGIQEEAPALGKPVLVLREATERPEAVAAGTVRLAGTDPERIFHEASRLLRDREAYSAMARAVNPYGDGRAAERIADYLRFRGGSGGRPPAPFSPGKQAGA